ncbi:MAG: hypothetical protein A2Y57_03065 [Candidatus Woykebacteria bacterium RBG_13_40_7b]|uniref:Metallo-beta-lactamase domain-containing protein n=1 Tax=Candidatus Woykebacteria bacterium RBG_13_40_7b TaxID=1802594 RepID=A0A1G1W980_9BACT|nr:MAG: hypothetical protein A2Y57_03065 [Candidatus Woykebacteria bacterium RBG_13_40_7b]
MKIHFLGTSAGWPLPRLGCKCKICASADPKDKRTRSQVLINEDLLVDAGPDTYYHLNNPDIDPTKIKYLAISHEHPDHTFGLWDLSHIYLERKEDKITKGGRSKIKIIVHPATYRKIQRLLFYKAYEIIQGDVNKPIRINDIEVSFLPVNHTDSTFGILIAGVKRFFWAPDFKTLPESTKKTLQGVDLICMDGSELKITTPSHQTILEGIALSKEIAAKQTYFVHIGHRALPHEELEKFVKKEGGENFHIPYDSLEINL